MALRCLRPSHMVNLRRKVLGAAISGITAMFLVLSFYNISTFSTNYLDLSQCLWATRSLHVDYRNTQSHGILQGSVFDTNSRSEPNVQFAIVLCHGTFDHQGKMAVDLNRQIRQITVLLKSAAALTSTTLVFSIVSDSNKTYELITNITKSWPEAYRHRIVFGERREIFYPPGTTKMKNMFRVCATERLFLPHVYPEKDALIFLDTDLFFLQPPEDLWTEFDNFESRHVVGISPCLYMYGPTFTKFPTFGSSGINAGVILMNMTRLRNFPYGWTESILKVVQKYKGKLKLADQDILNILFSKSRSSLMYELGCEWNYRQKVCSEGWNKCPGAASRGVAILHGAAMTFVNGVERKFQAAFEAWERYEVGMPLKKLIRLLEEALKKEGFSRGCGELSNIDNIMLKGLKRTVSLREEATFLKRVR